MGVGAPTEVPATASRAATTRAPAAIIVRSFLVEKKVKNKRKVECCVVLRGVFCFCFFFWRKKEAEQTKTNRAKKGKRFESVKSGIFMAS